MNRRPPYVDGGPFVARLGFDFGPLHFEPGDPVELEVHPHVLWGLWQAQQIDVAPAPVAAAVKPKAAKRATAGAA